MAQITVRNVDEQVLERLKKRAARNGRSLESEARRILTNAAKPSLGESREIVQRFRKERYGDRVLSDSAELIREDRDR